MAVILVIDDAPIIQELLKGVLEEDGHEVHTANDGEQGLGIFSDFQIDLSIVDIFLPKLGGLEVIGKLMERKQGHPIIVISGGEAFNPTSVLELTDIYGIGGTFSKPIDTNRLVTTVRELLGRGTTPTATT